MGVSIEFVCPCRSVALFPVGSWDSRNEPWRNRPGEINVGNDAGGVDAPGRSMKFKAPVIPVIIF
jgi:hypothetical protein